MKGNITVLFQTAQKHSWTAFVVKKKEIDLLELKCAILFVTSTIDALAGLKFESESRNLIM